MVQQPLRTATVHARSYDPANLLNFLQFLQFLLGAASDAALAQRLEVTAADISMLRRRRIPLTAGMLIRMSDFCEMSIEDLLTILGDRRSQIRLPQRRRRNTAEQVGRDGRRQVLALRDEADPGS
ncbi:hypothetical protein QN362_04420 [Actimicrobium sp. CCC2.4]|uniref:hypothetical protein n=1 Tax=Actimicrobium sp. CCC2.4 TaxID=3048606 RepID=UPI002AC95E1A|nr:hypothetical protein [Actimicrobium sp. CCC2.4]MEB0134571.1 hypothetical protein [Actimicrobium sp. CCC2.4]WPX34013.1 hypothetical protein RHM62_09500 [Actimicrobium sp. CCC2.4]